MMHNERGCEKQNGNVPTWNNFDFWSSFLKNGAYKRTAVYDVGIRHLSLMEFLQIFLAEDFSILNL